MTSTTSKTQLSAIVLFGHGSRDEQWKKPIEAVAARMRDVSPDVLVNCAYLEMTTPDLATVVSDLAAKGVTQISLLPMFLGVGRHAREDLPALVKTQESRFPDIAFKLRPSVGEEPAVVDLLAKIALE